jgi:Winged helix domain, variant/ATPase family associated with various cellular activities (AAA)
VSPELTNESSAVRRALERLDRLLAGAVEVAQETYGQEGFRSAYRGLYIGDDEVARLLAREAGAPVLWARDTEDEAPEQPELSWLRLAFGLDSFDVDVVLIALAPEVDLRYERLYGFLQDDVTRRRPSVELVLNLLCRDWEEKLERRSRFAPNAPLVREGIVRLLPETEQFQPPLLAHSIRLDEQITAVLLGDGGLDSRVAGFCELTSTDESLDALPVDPATVASLQELAAADTWVPPRLHLSGRRQTTKRRAAAAFAHARGVRLLTADIGRLDGGRSSLRELFAVLVREAWLQQAVLFVDGLERLSEDERSLLLDAIGSAQEAVVLAGPEPLAAVAGGRGAFGLLDVAIPTPSSAVRARVWQDELGRAGLEDVDVAPLAARFLLGCDEIADAVETATRSPGADVTTRLFAAARAQSGHELAELTLKVEPVGTWESVVLPDDTLAQLREICARVTHSEGVLEGWGFARKLSRGKGVSALFAGPSGTGKTLSAEILANQLGLDLYRCELAGVVSKYIGETEKNLDRIFAAAEGSNAILLFDEAEALFGKRSEVRDSHDRYANIEVAYLLQKIEAYDGIAILATNLQQNLDDAFTRRLAFTVHFPFPEAADRRRIWSVVWPAETPLGDDVDLDLLADEFPLSGGNIKNIALAAAFLAAEGGGPVRMEHLLHATRREYQKLGKSLPEPVDPPTVQAA